MATYYIWNTNIVEKNCNFGSTVTFNISGTVVSVAGGKDNKARLNISPYLQALFGSIGRNTNTAFAPVTDFTLDGVSHTAKYGYKKFGETSEWSGGCYTRYNTNSATKECEILLRWLDHFGSWRYWVFKRGSHSVTDASGGDTLTSNIGANTFSRPQLKSHSKSLNICATLCNELEFDFLCDIKQSINVCVKEGSTWIPVTVTTGTTTWATDKNQKMQDFELTINYPENTISL